MSLAERIRTARTEAGLSQAKLAVALEVHERTPLRWENGQAQPRHRQLRRLAEITGKPVSFFVEHDEDEDEAASPSHDDDLLDELMNALAMVKARRRVVARVRRVTTPPVSV